MHAHHASVKYIAIFLFCSFMRTSANESERFWVTIQASSADERTVIAKNGMSLEEIESNCVSGIADTESIAALANSGFTIKSALPLSLYNQALHKASAITRSPYRFTKYHEMVATVQALADENPELVTLFSLGHSYEGRELWTLQLTKTCAPEAARNKPAILFVGNHHAREHLSCEVCLALANYLCENKKSSTIANLLDSIVIYIVPIANPDGTNYDLAHNPYAGWRKNRRINNDRSIGVDLNRNYDYMWSGQGKSDRPSSETYGGTHAFSESETQAIKTFVETHKNITLFVSYHSYGKLILYPWGCKHNPVENLQDRAVYINLAKKLSQLTGYTAMQAASQYVAPGDAVDWAYATHHIFSFSFELMPISSSQGGFYPTNSPAIHDDLDKNIQAGLYLCHLCNNPYQILSDHVR